MNLKLKMFFYKITMFVGLIISFIGFIMFILLGYLFSQIEFLKNPPYDILRFLVLISGIILLTYVTFRACHIVDSYMLKKRILFLDKFVDSGDLILSYDTTDVISDVKKVALDNKFYEVNLNFYAGILFDNFDKKINLHKILIEEPNVIKLEKVCRYYKFKNIDFKYYNDLKELVDMSKSEYLRYVILEKNVI